MRTMTFVFFFFLTFLASSNVSLGGNREAFILFSWIRVSPASSSSFRLWNVEDGSPCKWPSVTCNSQGFVTGIDIQSVPLHVPLSRNFSSLAFLERLVVSDANVTGGIPLDLYDCVSLRVLDLSSNSISGFIDGAIGKMTSLEDLILNSNRITGGLPPGLGNCANLRNLLLFDNMFTGKFPGEIGKLKRLEVIRAGGNKGIVGDIPEELGQCGNLTVLGLAETGVSGNLPAAIGNLTKLKTMSIYTTMISGEIPSSIGNCAELVNLFLYENSLSGHIPAEIGRLTKLEHMFLWDNGLSGDIPGELGNCLSLRMLDLSSNSLSGSIPASVGNLVNLEEFMISDNNVTGNIPVSFSRCLNLAQLQVDTNQIAGPIPPEIGSLSNLKVLLAWQNLLEGTIPSNLSSCRNLQALDLSHNMLSGPVPSGLFGLRNLTKLMLISNQLTGILPPEIGNCVSLVRLRLGNNMIGGSITEEIGKLRNLVFLDVSRNHLAGNMPESIGNCSNLQMIDLSINMLSGSLPESISYLKKLQVLDVSGNRLTGEIPASVGELSSLNKLVMNGNMLSGDIPASIAKCRNLQLLDLGGNNLTGDIPWELGRIESLEIALNLSCNMLTNSIPREFASLTKLSILDLSFNHLFGDLSPLGKLEDIVTLNVSYNNFSGYLPDNKVFRQLGTTDLVGNPLLCSTIRNACFRRDGLRNREKYNWRALSLKISVGLLVILMVVMMCTGLVAILRASRKLRGDDDTWHFTAFQKVNFSVDEMLRSLTEGNVIGKGCSGTVYKANMENGEVIAVKKLWPNMCQETRDSFSAEVSTLGSIRHKNIVRLLGCCWNQNTRFLMYDFMPNGSLGSLLHERRGDEVLRWELRFQIIVGAAQGLAYLHHDCVPPIAHRDIKANNILIGLQFEPYIADFGLAKLVDEDHGRSSNTVAGSYGYIAPEYGYMLKITEKSDVYSYGVVVLEVLTGKQPIDPTIPEGLHVVDWVRESKGGAEVLDGRLVALDGAVIEEMMQVLGVAMLCVSPNPEERPSMRDVAALLKEIKQEREEYDKVNLMIAESCGRKDSNAVIATPSSKQGISNLSPYDSFSASSLLCSSSSSRRAF